MNGEIAGVFIYNGQPQNGALAQLWKITGFATYDDSTDEVESTPLEAVDIELTVNAGGTFAIGGVIKMGTELCRITDISTNLLYIIRGYRGTTPAQHVQNVQIDDETITEPAQDTAVPTGSQQGGDVTTGVAYGGDGAYRWTAVPEGEYYVSVTYDAHIAWLYASVETNDPTPEQLLRLDGDTLIRNADGVTRLPGGAIGQFYQMDANRPTWGAVSGLTKEFWVPVTFGKTNPISDFSDYPAVECGDAGENAWISFFVPNDYSAITNAVVVCEAKDALAADNITVNSDYCAVGEAFNTHSESAAIAITATVAHFFEINIAGILSNLAIGDYVGINVLGIATTEEFFVLGIRFRYS